MSALNLRGPLSCRIAGTGEYLPGAPLTNREVLERVGSDGPRGPRDPEMAAALLFDQLGVGARHWVHPVGEPFADDEATTVDLGAIALERALGDARCSVSDLGAIISATSTPARVTGANAPQIAGRLGARCAAFDVRAGCTGGLLAFVQGCLFAATTRQPIAVVGADAFSLVIPPHAPLAALALGDGAGAAILVPDDADGGLIASSFDADGSIDGVGHVAPFPCTHERIDAGAYWLGGVTDTFVTEGTKRCAASAARVLEAAALDSDDIDFAIPQQSSAPAIARFAEAVGVEPERTAITVADHGNCGAAGLLIALNRGRQHLVPGARILLTGIGGGLTWGAAVFRIGGSS